MNDNCPNCLERDIAPVLARRRGQRTRHGYECPRCWQQWITERIDSAYPVHAARYTEAQETAA